MKAKEYYEQYLKADNKEQEILVIARSFLDEIKQLMESRHAKSNASIIAILEELNKKWMRFASLANTDENSDYEVKYRAFRELIKKYFPLVYDAWMATIQND